MCTICAGFLNILVPIFGMDCVNFCVPFYGNLNPGNWKNNSLQAGTRAFFPRIRGCKVVTVTQNEG